jgi:RAT1-interacting protein
VVGFRTPAGKLATFQSFKTMQIPRLVRDKPEAWDPGVCLEFGHRFLEFVKDIITGEDRSGGPDIKPNVWRVQFVPRDGITVYKLDEMGVEEVRANEERSGFLPNWYWEELQKEEVIRHQSVMPANSKGSAILPAGWTIG